MFRRPFAAALTAAVLLAAPAAFVPPVSFPDASAQEASAEEEMRVYSVASKLNGDWDFLMELHELGRAKAETWLAENFQHLGRKSTIDIRDKYL